MAKRTCRLHYYSWAGEGTKPKAIQADVARSMLGIKLFAQLRSSACREGHAVRARTSGWYYVVAKRRKLG